MLAGSGTVVSTGAKVAAVGAANRVVLGVVLAAATAASSAARVALRSAALAAFATALAASAWAMRAAPPNVADTLRPVTVIFDANAIRRILFHRQVVSLSPVIRLDAATFLLQWAVGGLFFCWFTTRRRIVGIGYGWLLRGTFLLIAAGAFACGVVFGYAPVRDTAALGVALAAFGVLIVSIVRRKAGVSGADAEFDRRSARVAEMTGIERDVTERAPSHYGPEFPPVLDLIAPAIGLVGLVAAGIGATNGGFGTTTVSVLRTVVGAAFLGAVTDAMLLGHWYLVQPGLPRRLLNELVTALGIMWPLEVVSLLLPTGMVSVWTGAVDDGWGGTLGWFWAASAVTTIVLVFVTRAALRERYYSAVMAATGLLYLAILTAFGTDLVARAVLAG